MTAGRKKAALKHEQPYLLQRDGLFYLLVVIRIFPAGWQLLERFGEDLSLVVSGPSHSFIELKDWVAHLHA